jgi:hypothetical protein
VLRHRFAWKRLSTAGALVYEPDGSDAHLVFQLRPGQPEAILFLVIARRLDQALPTASFGAPDAGQGGMNKSSMGGGTGDAAAAKIASALRRFLPTRPVRSTCV